MADAGELTPEQIVEKIVAEKTVNKQLISALESHIQADWVVDHDEVEMLFKCNQAIDHEDQVCPEWIRFFKDVVARLVVMDMHTPGEIDEEEGNWLAGVVEKYEVGNEAEEKLFYELQNLSTSISGRIGDRLTPFDN